MTQLANTDSNGFLPDRRQLALGGLASLAGLTLTSTSSAARRVLGFGVSAGTKNLVLVQLSGGNDGLATVVPHGVDELHRARNTTARKQAELLALDDERGLHPALERLHRRFESGTLAIVEGCGYPEGIRSHFKSLEVWHTGRLTGRASGEGWIGRLAAAAWAKEDHPELVVHLGRQAPYSVYSTSHPPVALESPTGYQWFGSDGADAAYDMAGAALCEECDSEGQPLPPPDARHAGRDAALAQLRNVLDDARRSSTRIRRSVASYQTQVDYPRDRFAATLRDVAALIHADLGTRVFSVTLGGFDTHANQRPAHDRLMQTLDAGLGTFLTDLDRSPRGQDTVVLVFSEFGRRVGENGSRGHDHGKAGPMFVLGPKVRGGLYGERPSLTELDKGDLAFTTDFRSVYATIVRRWFGVEPQAVLGREYPELGFLG